ncbi:MAG: hypothetical protein ACUVTB_04415 [Candidatus Bathycorpusculaceae bacterium]
MSREKRVNVDRLVVGGLHMGDFEWASRQYEELGYVLVAFVLDVDGYHWKAVYVKADCLEKSEMPTNSGPSNHES